MEDRGFSDRGFSDLLSTASSILSSQSHSASQSSSQPQSSTPSSTISPSSAATSHHSRPPSQEDVMASAQFIMNAAKSKMRKGEGGSDEEIDMGKLAGAAGNIIAAASHYGKLDQSRYGKYAQKAEDYLYSYEGKHGKPNVASAGTATHTAPAQAAQPANIPQGYSSGNVQSTPTAPQGYSQGYSSQGYSDPAQGSRPAGSQGYSAEPYQRKPAESQDYPIGYPPAGYPTSDNRPRRNYY